MKSEMGRRKGRNTDDFFLMNALGIARESAAIIVQNSSLFLSIALILVSPVSAALLLSRAVLPRAHFASKMALQIGDYAGFPNWRYVHLIYNKLSQTVISYMLCFPFVFTFSLLARAALAHTVACIYAGNWPSWRKLIQAFPKLWKGLVVTYIWAGMVVVGANAVIVGLVLTAIKAVTVLGFDSKWEVGPALGGGIVYSIVFAHAMIVANLATVVCVMEECNYGMKAVFRAVFLIKGRTKIALVMSVIINLSWAFVESLFVYRVMGSRNVMMAWEAPLLVFIYSVLGVMDCVMSCVFYYTCKSSRLEDVSLALQIHQQNSISVPNKTAKRAGESNLCDL